MSQMTETRALKMHNKLLLDVIKRQAGSLEKAILEGTMNAIEAGAPKVDINLVIADGKAKLEIIDKGRGIQTRQEIEDFFEQFGTPHSESENKVWAQFRMGRGQLFSYGRNVWRTSTFQMVVDINANGLSYDLTENLPHVDGCRIEIDLYENPISGYYSIDRLKDSILRQVKFMSTPVNFNGQQISVNPKTLNWTMEDDAAFYLFDASDGLYIYNLGAFVKMGSASEFGVAGIVVSKKQLKVNFARNDVNNDCPVYSHIKTVAYDNRIKQTRKEYRSLLGHERIATLADLSTGMQSYDDVKTLGLLDKSSGGKVSLIFMKTYKGFWSFAPACDNVADKLTQSGSCLCLDKSVLAKVGYHGEPANFFSWICPELSHLDGQYVPFANARSTLREDYTVLSSTKWTPVEKRIVKILQRSYDWGRNILIGLSDTANGWTDGSSYIVINRDYLERNNPVHAYGAAAIVSLMIHELAHDCDTAGSHNHGPEFYERFHDLCRLQYGPFSAVATFRAQIMRARLDEVSEKQRARIARKENIRNRKLGLPTAASSS